MARDEAPDDPTTLIEFVLDSLATDCDLDELVREVGAWHQASSTFPTRALLELAANAFAASGATRSDPLELDGLARRLLPEWPARGNTAHAKRRHCVNAAVLIAAGAEPEDTSWWRVDDLWLHSLDAVIVFVRAAAERRRLTVDAICDELRATRA